MSHVHRGGIARLRIKDGKLLSGDMFGQVAMWDTTTWACEILIDAAVGPIQLLDFGASAMVMTAISKSGVCRIWDLKTRMLISSAPAIDVTCMTMDDECLVLGNRDGQIQVVDFYTGEPLRTSAPIAGESLQDIYIQNNTLVVVTGHSIRIMSIETLEVLLSCPVPISPTIRTYCSVFHIRSLILLTDQHLLHVQWEPLYRAPNKKFIIDTRCELPPDLTKVPSIHRTKVPPILTITSIAIGGKHPHVLTTNADRPCLSETIRVCGTNIRSPYNTASGSQRPLPHTRGDDAEQPVPEAPVITEDGAVNDMMADDMGTVLTSQVEEISKYLETCGLKPSFMDVDEDVIIIGTSKGDIVVLHMMPQES
ncbi:hypothetical protein BGZ50_000543 [Haplosporangium sp. Z 11]|nr:hypothetical protein BGZ50_000543 [Haplosporangium sp. Z 11]